MRHYLLLKNTCGRVTLNEESNNDGLNIDILHLFVDRVSYIGKVIHNQQFIFRL